MKANVLIRQQSLGALQQVHAGLMKSSPLIVLFTRNNTIISNIRAPTINHTNDTEI